jgi:hypothetical protein
MESLYKFIENHKKEDRTRSSFSNLVKKIKLENELFYFVENYLEFGTFKQKLYHIINKLPKSKIICDVCNERYLNWVENSNTYRTTCSIKCAGKLTGKKNRPKRDSHPKLSKKDEFKEYFKLNKIKLTESNIKKVYPELFNEIKNEIKFETDKFSEKVYFFLNDLKSRPICKHCNYNVVKFDTFINGYHDYCSVKCSSNSKDKKEKIEKTCLYKYGVKNIGEVTRDKASNTIFKKYGVDNFSKTEEFKSRYKETCLEKYGEEHFSKVDEINKFRVDNPMKNEYIVEKSLYTKKQKGIIYKWSNNELKDIQSYRRSVSYYTEKTYEEYKDIINPNGLDRGIHSNHIDHIFPVIEGWKNRIDPKVISNYKNLRLIDSYDNLSKGERTNISVDEFYEMINS